DLIGAMIVDGAKTVAEADPEVSEAVDFARYYPRALEETRAELEGAEMDPLGVVVVAPPWNFPLSIPASGVLAALTAGNVVLLKPAPEAVLVGWQLAQALWDGGVPMDALQFVPCPDDDVGQSLVTDPRVDAVILTGSAETARRFLAWRPELRLFAETSGKDAMMAAGAGDRGSRPSGLGQHRQEVLGSEPRHLRSGGLRRRRLPTPAPRRGGEPRRRQRMGDLEPHHRADPAARARPRARPHHPR